MNVYSLLIVALLVACVGMIVTWRVARSIDNYSIVDAVWAFEFTALAAIYFGLGAGWTPRKLLMLAAAGLWSLRLGTFLARRIRSHHPHEDGRYAKLRAEYAPHAERGFFRFFQLQAFSVVALAMPFLIMASNPTPAYSAVEIVGGAVWLLSWLGESIADAQAQRFKKNPANRGRVCREGLWKFSRHPNYFFESCIWWGFYLMALGSPYGVGMIYCPLGITFLLLKVTGVPMAEAQSLLSRGEEYRDYQRTTSVFVPWFPKAFLWILIVLASLPMTSSMAASSAAARSGAIEVRSADIYRLGNKGRAANEAPLFTQKTSTRINEAGVAESLTEIHDRGGGLVLRERAETQGSRLIHQHVQQFQTGEAYDAAVVGGKVVFKTFELKGERETPKGEESESVTPEFLTGPVATAYLRQNWAKLLAGKSVHGRFGVLEVAETVGFDFSRSDSRADNESVTIRMSASSVFISLAVAPIEMDFDARGERMLRFRGRTPLRALDRGKMKPLDAEIIYR